MNPIPLVRVSALLPCLRFLKEIGAPVPRLLSAVKLPIAVCDDPEALIPLHQGCHFLEQAARSQGIAQFGAQVGQQARLAELGAFGRLICGSFTLYEAITTVARLIATHNSGECLWLSVRGEQARLCHRYVASLDRGRQQAEHYALMYLLQLIRLAGGDDWRPAEIHFETGAAPGLGDFEPVAGARLVFNQPATVVMLPRALLSRPLAGGEVLPPRHPATEPALWASAPAGDFHGSARQVIKVLLQDGYPDIGLVADVAGVSIRTLQRRLAANDLSYSRLVEQVRFEKAVHLLANTPIKLVEVAFELGYTEAANFTRAFRRWTGVTPREFRHQRLAGTLTAALF
jgi:AraC-like DNA-binding protein